MKKLSLCALFLLSLTACGDEEPEKKEVTQTKQQEKKYEDMSVKEKKEHMLQEKW
ncbi:hypothetical protein ACPV30_19395 [Photobacterium damselae]|uniref:hypothetical protein n=1 Tax=Photobacterium damselae TaxID=38293 RepID=UPI0040682009